jgi:hypothetical protein
MARRRKYYHQRAHYYHRNPANPISETELVVGGLVGLAILGVGGYLLYTRAQTSATTAANNALNANAVQNAYNSPAPTVDPSTL